MNAGHTISLPCLVDQLEGFVLLWRKDERIISVGDQIVDKVSMDVFISQDINTAHTVLIQNTAEESEEWKHSCNRSCRS